VRKDFAAESFFFVAAAAYRPTVSYSVSCWVNIFSLANYIMITSLDELFSVAEFCMHGSLFMQFLSITIS